MLCLILLTRPLVESELDRVVAEVLHGDRHDGTADEAVATALALEQSDPLVTLASRPKAVSDHGGVWVELVEGNQPVPEPDMPQLSRPEGIDHTAVSGRLHVQRAREGEGEPLPVRRQRQHGQRTPLVLVLAEQSLPEHTLNHVHRNLPATGYSPTGGYVKTLGRLDPIKALRYE